MLSGKTIQEIQKSPMLACYYYCREKQLEFQAFYEGKSGFAENRLSFKRIRPPTVNTYLQRASAQGIASNVWATAVGFEWV
jgi:hypothetical protein